jgi:DNA-binding FadR family transcriptional regulator
MAKTTLIDQTAQRLKKYIEENKLSSGDKLPNEYELSKILNVGRNTVREAVRHLVSRNILATRQGAGTFVSENTGIVEDPFGFSFTNNQDKLVKDLMEIRIMIEPQIAALAAQNSSHENIEHLEKLCRDIEEAIKNKADFSKEDELFHSYLGKCSGNDVISKLIPVISEGINIYATSVSEQEYQQTLISHRKIVDAIKKGRPRDAEEAMLFHLLYNKNRF